MCCIILFWFWVNSVGCTSSDLATRFRVGVLGFVVVVVVMVDDDATETTLELPVVQLEVSKYCCVVVITIICDDG